MRFVERAEIRPHRCAVIPTIAGDHKDGFFDTGSEMPGFDNHVYVSVVAVEEMARKLGWKSPAEFTDLEDQNAALARELEHANAELRETQHFMDAIDVIESRDFRARRKAGRPKKQAPEAA